jgi:hypothetical protein
MQHEGGAQQAAAGQPAGRNKSKRNKFKQGMSGAVLNSAPAEASVAVVAELAAQLPPDAPVANGAARQGHSLTQTAEKGRKPAGEDPAGGPSQPNAKFAKKSGSNKVQALHAEQADRAEGKQQKKARRKEDDMQRLAGRKAARPSQAGAPEQATGLLARMREQLSGGRFRWLNEQLYSCPGEEALALMQGQPELFLQYHEVGHSWELLP